MALALTISIPRSRPKNIATYPKDHRINRHFASRKTRRAQIRKATGYPHPQAMPRMYGPKESDPVGLPRARRGNRHAQRNKPPARSGLRSVPGLEPTNRRVIDVVA